jgi:mRNA-degrading endonuclease RelE of RelBE toxin-antitoxin system
VTPWLVNLTGPARRDLSHLQPQVAQRIIRALRLLAETGHGDTKKLTARGDEYRLRVGDWRITFERDSASRTINVIRILPRGRAYRD